MTIELGWEHRAVRETAREFAETELRPLVEVGEEQGEVPRRVLSDLAEYGLRGAQVPVEYGGSGMGMLSHAVIMEEVSRVWPSAGLKLDEGLLRLIRLFGTADQKETYLPGLAAAELLDAIALSEPDHGSDLAGITTTAKRAGDGYRIDGTKMWVSGAGSADLLAVAAKTEPGERHRGMSLFLVPTDAEGVAVQPPEDLLGFRASPTHEVRFDDVTVPEGHLLGEENRGFYHTMEMLEENRIAVAARGLGVATGAAEAATRYALERRQFDRPIAEFQAIRHKVADMTVKVENARHLVYNAARRCDASDPFETEASMAKLYASEAAREVANEAVQIHGGYGYTTDFDVERFYRDAKGLEIYEGTSEIQRNVIADAVLG